MSVELNVKQLVVHAVYAPTGDNNEKSAFWKRILQLVKKEKSDVASVIVGDCNVVPDQRLDNSVPNGGACKVVKFCKLLESYVVDTWRKLNGVSKQFTYFKNGSSGVVETRIDHILCSRSVDKYIIRSLSFRKP